MTGNSDKAGRDYDVVVMGASGFTGKLVTEYLQQRYPNGGELKWAIAGRSRQKLEQVLAELAIDANAPDVLIADSHDAESLAKLAGNTRVVLTTVGPYALYGSELVAACVANGTDYCDLSGEVHWMRQMIDRHQQAAEASGARIVHSCGFDSIPSDLGVQFLQRYAQSKYGKPCGRVELLVKAMKGGGSGGTIASALNALDEGRKDRAVARTMVDPYSLNPADERTGPDRRDQRTMEYNTLARSWTAPFIMAVINMRVVRRSNAVMNYPYGRQFRYRESVLTGAGPGGWMKSAAIVGGTGAFLFASSFSLSRSMLVDRLIPKPGEGPGKKERENGFFNLILLGELEDGTVIRARVKGDRDPGYGSTSKMLSESAVCLAKDRLEVGGGLWTPASAMGPVLLDRLTCNAGLSFEIE